MPAGKYLVLFTGNAYGIGPKLFYHYVIVTTSLKNCQVYVFGISSGVNVQILPQLLKNCLYAHYQQTYCKEFSVYFICRPF
ncbi:hypothetical protein GCM10027043_45340 [Ferruginibacter profundus]